MTKPMLPHLADDLLSALVDDQLEPAERAPAQAHLATCLECRQRLEELRSVASMLRTLPTLEPPRSFALGPRVVGDPPNVVRLRRWYTASRIVAGSLAAVFVLMSASALYVDSRPATQLTSSSEAFSGAGASQAQTARDAAKPAAALAPAAPPAATAVPVVAPAAAPAAARSAPASNAAGGEAADQIAAATSVRPLPTPPPPTPTRVTVPTAIPVVARVAVPMQVPDEAAPFRSGALALGLLTVVALLVALLVRHRLQQASSPP
jgi:Putative zinc-finger